MGLINNSIIINAIKLALSKKNFLIKIKYLLLGLIFIPFLFLQNKDKHSNKSNTSEQSLAGDDIYPLF